MNEKAFDDLVGLLHQSNGNIRYGGSFDKENLFISPTILDMIAPDDELMHQEIFGQYYL